MQSLSERVEGAITARVVSLLSKYDSGSSLSHRRDWMMKWGYAGLRRQNGVVSCFACSTEPGKVYDTFLLRFFPFSNHTVFDDTFSSGGFPSFVLYRWC